MSESEEEFVKVVIDLPDAEDGVGGEGVWSVKVGEDRYEIRNSPWHTLEINFMDVVRAIAPAENKNPVVQEVVRRGGHRAIQIVFCDEGMEKKDVVFARVEELGASYENADGKLYAIDLPPQVDFDSVADYFEECQEMGWLEQRYAAQPQAMGTEDLVN
jgi:hypothetical protein